MNGYLNKENKLYNLNMFVRFEIYKQMSDGYAILGDVNPNETYCIEKVYGDLEATNLLKYLNTNIITFKSYNDFIDRKWV
jgi:hypothetical protein